MVPRSPRPKGRPKRGEEGTKSKKVTVRVPLEALARLAEKHPGRPVASIINELILASIDTQE